MSLDSLSNGTGWHKLVIVKMSDGRKFYPVPHGHNPQPTTNRGKRRQASRLAAKDRTAK